jgi:hypothetical protein
MPGIAGIISPKPARERRRLVEAMIGSMKHEPFYTGGTFSIREMGIYKGWIGMKNQDKRPTNALLARAVELCEARKCSNLTYWNYTYGNNANSSLVIESRDG